MIWRITMAILTKDKFRKRVIDLTGPEGNAYYLLGLDSKLCKDIGLDDTMVLNDMKSGDYEHLIKTFDNKFGMIIDLER